MYKATAALTGGWWGEGGHLGPPQHDCGRSTVKQLEVRKNTLQMIDRAAVNERDTTTR
jgi:hypothetical protein